MFVIKDLFRHFLEVLDTTKSDRKGITLRCPRGGRGAISPPAGFRESPSGVLGAKSLVIFIQFIIIPNIIKEDLLNQFNESYSEFLYFLRIESTRELFPLPPLVLLKLIILRSNYLKIYCKQYLKISKNCHSDFFSLNNFAEKARLGKWETDSFASPSLFISQTIENDVFSVFTYSLTQFNC